MCGVLGIRQDILGREARQWLMGPGVTIPADRATRCTKDPFPRLGFQATNVAQIGIKPTQQHCIALFRRRQTDCAWMSAEVAKHVAEGRAGGGSKTARQRSSPQEPLHESMINRRYLNTP